jgi:hypothetical protein
MATSCLRSRGDVASSRMTMGVLYHDRPSQRDATLRSLAISSLRLTGPHHQP